MKTLVAALTLLALVVPAHAEDPPEDRKSLSWRCINTDYEYACVLQGMKDYREGLCFRARPWSGNLWEGKLWERGYDTQSKKKSRDMSHCYGTRGQH